MLSSRRESLHSDGITDPKNLQQTSATKSAKSGRGNRASNLVIRLHDLSSYLMIDESLYSSCVACFGTIDTEQDASGPA
jgi:hypothetical protein